MTTPKLVKLTTADRALLHQIGDRAYRLALANKVSLLPTDIILDLCIAISDGMVPLDLPALLNAPDGQFVHDVWGIRNHINRETGRLTDCFWPRYTLKEGG